MSKWAVIIGILGFFFSSSAQAQMEKNGVLNAVSYSPFQAKGTIGVKSYDDSTLNLKLKELFETALREAGYDVSDDANVILSFVDRDEAGSWVHSGDRTYIELHNNPERNGSKQPKVLLNLYNSDRGGIFNSGKGNREVTPRKYRLDTTIDNKIDGRRVWHAWSITNAGSSNSATLAASMVPLLVKSLGQSIRSQLFKIK